MTTGVVERGGSSSPSTSSSSSSAASPTEMRRPSHSAETERGTDPQPPPSSRRYEDEGTTLVSVEYIQQLWLMRSISRTLLAPVERVKYIMQCQRELQRTGALQCEFKTVWSCVRYLKHIEGTRSFWRGNMIQVASVLPILLAQIFVAYPTQSFIFNSCPVHTAAGYTAASYLALLGGAVAATTISYPLEFARFRLAVDIKPRVGTPYVFRNSFAFFSNHALSECPHYLYRGLTLYIFGSLVYQSVHGALLRIVTPYVPPEEADSGWTPVILQTVAGLTVSGLTTLCLHPVDLVRHRMMIAVMDDHARYSSMMECAARIAQREGVRGFFRGATVTLTKMVLATSLALIGLPY